MKKQMTRTECLYHLKRWYGSTYHSAVLTAESGSPDDWEAISRELSSPTFEEFADSKSLALDAFYTLSGLTWCENERF